MELIVAIIFVGWVGYSMHKSNRKMMGLALAEKDPIVRQFKVEKALEYRKARFFKRADLKKAIEA